MKNDLTRSALVCLLAFSWACAGTPGEDNNTPTPDAGTPDTDVDPDAGEQDSWSFTIVDQELDEDDPTSVAATSISTTTPSWIVVHEDDDGELGPILGQVSIASGETSSIEITLTRPALDGELLHAALHVDGGDVGTFEYPDGADVPVLGATGEPLSYAFTVTVPVTYVPAVVATDQISPSDGEDPPSRVVTIPSVVSPTTGWIVIHEQTNLVPGDVIGWSAVGVGENDDVSVKLDRELVSGETLYAMLHADMGVVGTYEFPDGADVPIQDGDGNVIAPTFLVDVPSITMGSPFQVESLFELKLDRVVAAEAGWVVVREEADDELGDALGVFAVAEGESVDVVVPLTARPLLNGERVRAQLFAEDGDADTYDGTEPSVDDLAGNTAQAAVLIEVDSSVGASIYVVDQELGEQNRVTLGQVTWGGSNSATHVVIYEGDPNDMAAYLPEPIGLVTSFGSFVSTDIEITLGKTLAPGTMLWVVFHDDTTPGGFFESESDLVLEYSDGTPIAASFSLLTPAL